MTAVQLPVPGATITAAESEWDTSYEWKAVVLLSLGFGLVGLDRLMILPMFPVIMKDLHLSYQELGQITGILAIAWGISGFFTGRLSDRIGRRKVVVSAMIVFSVLVGITGLATGLGLLLLLRAIMGLADGAYTPPSIVATLEASKPTRHGMNLGIQQTMLPVFGVGLAPIFVTQMLHVVDWRWIFVLVTPPGLLIAFLLSRVLRDPSEQEEAVTTATRDLSEHKWTDIFLYRNIPLNMGGMLCWLTCLIITSAFLPSYFVEYLHLGLNQMSLILSAQGFGGGAGALILPFISDRIGRKPVMIFSTIGAFVCYCLLIRVGAQPGILFALLFGANFFGFGLITLTVGPLSAESVPAKLMATASGAVICVGEVFGGGIAPVIAGSVASHFGIQYIVHLAAGAMVIGFVISLCLRETAPRRLRAKFEPVPAV